MINKRLKMSFLSFIYYVYFLFILKIDYLLNYCKNYYNYNHY